MTAESSAGAVSHILTDWHSIPWKMVNEHVRRLQARIVQATKVGKWHKVQALQHLLTHSLSGKALAVRRVTSNRAASSKYTLFGLSVGCKPPRCLESTVPEEQIMYTEFVH